MDAVGRSPRTEAPERAGFAVRVLAGILFLFVVLSLLGGGHLYIAQRLVHDPEWSAGVEFALLAGLATMAGLLVVAPSAGRFLPRWIARLAAWPAFTWLGAGFLLIVALAVSDLVLGLLLWGTGGIEGWTPVEWARLRAWIVGGGVGAGVCLGLRSALRLPGTRRVEVTLERWPRALDGFRVVQLSDLHLGPMLGRRFAEGVVARANELDADLVAITGDLVDGEVSEIGPLAEPFRDLRSRHGSYFVTGNHDHYSGADPWTDRVRELGIRPLRNERVEIDARGAGFDLAGVDDHRGDFGSREGGEDLSAALADRDPARALVLLAHDPTTFRRARHMGVDLQVSGHTHGGQIWPFGLLVRLAVPYLAGLYSVGPDAAPSQIYVSRGTGFWGPPLRIFAPAEITLITLRSSRAAEPDAEAA